MNTTKTILVTLMLALFGMSSIYAQVGIGTTDPNASAALDVKATDKGFLPPRMTENDKTSIATPIPAGLMIFCTDCGCGEMQVYDGTEWLTMAGSGVAPDAPTITSAANATGPGTVDIAFTAPANDGGKAITSYTATSSPGGFTGTVSQAGSGTITVSGLDCETSYTFTVTATNCAGTSVASTASSSVTTPLEVGCFQDGGVVFYLASPPADLDGDGANDTGLVVAVNIAGTDEWSLTNSLVGTSTAIGQGKANTDAIVADQGTTGGNYAARLADDYAVTVDGTLYNDWFLPSLDEMFEISNNLNIINPVASDNGGGFDAGIYGHWTSSEHVSFFPSNFAYAMRLNDGFINSTVGETKIVATNPVLVVRAF